MTKIIHRSARPRAQKITFGDMRESGVRGVLIYCADHKCSHSISLSADTWSDDLRLSDAEQRFTCTACGKHGADIRPDFNWDGGAPPGSMGFRKVD